MKYLCGLLMIVGFLMQGQTNLVPNPSFEDTIACPQAPGEITKANGWSSLSGSPDYMNSCCQFSMGVPNNWGGYQYASSGVAYAALVTFSSSSANYREFISHQLLTSLTIGVKYYISFKVSLSLGQSANGNCASDKLGAMFSTGSFASITNIPPLYSSSKIIDTLNWTRVFGSFTADSNYAYITIGNFFDDGHTDTTKFYSTFDDVAYYYVDDVCLSTDSLFAANYSYTGQEEFKRAAFSVFPNPVNNTLFIKTATRAEFYRVLNLEGIIQKEGKLNKNCIDVSEVKNGFYFIEIDGETFSKIIINHNP